MTKEDLVNAIAEKTGIEKVTIQKTIEAFMESVRDSMIMGNNVYLRGFGSFIVKKRARKTARNISKNTTILIPAHNIPAFKPAETFIATIKTQRKPKRVSGPDKENIPAFKPSKPFNTKVKIQRKPGSLSGTDDDGPGVKGK